MVQVEIKDAIAPELLFGSLQKGGEVRIDVAPGINIEAPAKAGGNSTGESSGEFVFSYAPLETAARNVEPALA